MSENWQSRLKEERERLKASQTEFGKWGGVSLKTQNKYEKAEDCRPPDADYLRGIEEHGVDILYIVTGRRVSLSGSSESAASYSKPEDALMAVLAAQDEMGLSFTAAQIKVLLGFAWKYQVDSDDVKEFIQSAYNVAGKNIPTGAGK